MSTADGSRTVAVLTVDDQPLFRRAAIAVVDATPGFEAIGEAASGEEALALASTLRPDLILLDVRMPGMDGIETARRLTAAHPDIVVVLISLDDTAGLAALARSAGAVAWLPKQLLGPTLLTQLWTNHRRG
jgi:DNA-binding NarL/FixJ family response regulator